MNHQPLRRFPWWASILIGATLYCALTYLAPHLQPANDTLAKLFALAPELAPIVTIPFLLLGAKQLYDIPPEEPDQDDDSPNVPPGPEQ
jgi:hypothetical protein